MASLLIAGFTRIVCHADGRLVPIRYADVVVPEAHDSIPAYTRKERVRQWDVFQLFTDRQRMGVLGGPRCRDFSFDNAPMGRYQFFTLRVPSINFTDYNKALIEQYYEVWPDCGRDVATRLDSADAEKLPESSVERAFYVDYESFPEHCKHELLDTGESTLTEAEARESLKHKHDASLVSQLFWGRVE